MSRLSTRVGHRHRTNRMGESAVDGAGKYEVQQTVLSDVSQTLEYPSVDHRSFKRGDSDIAVDWIAKEARA